MFRVDYDTMEITMHKGDTGSFSLKAAKKSGDPWTADDRLQFVVAAQDGTIMIWKYFRLDDGRAVSGFENGEVVIEFHNDDTDDWPTGVYNTELRYDITPVWDGDDIPEDDIVDATRTDIAHICEGSCVRTVIQSHINIQHVYGRI